MQLIKNLRYFFEFIIIQFLFLIFKIIGLKLSTALSSNIFRIVGPFFRSKKIIKKNLSFALPNISDEDIKKISNNMWSYYGKIFAEYSFIKKFRNDLDDKNIEIKGKEILKKIAEKKDPVIFVSAHFDNFELMAMYLEKSNIDLAAIYRPLNNYILNSTMEKIRKKYICKNQIKKGLSSVRSLIKLFKNGSSIALMIDQRVSEGLYTEFFGKKAYTTTIPAQFVKKFKCKIVPIYIERLHNNNFNLEIFDPMDFENNKTIEEITLSLNIWLEKMILRNPSQWIWSHNRWK